MASNLELLGIGSRIRDNDPRMPNRELCIVGFEGGAISAHGGVVKAICEVVGLKWKRQYRINVRSIHTDNKPRRSGFALVGTFVPASTGSKP